MGNAFTLFAILLAVFAHSCASPSKVEKTKKVVSPLDAVTIEGCAANWSAACERAIQAPPPELEEAKTEIPKKKKFKKRKKRTGERAIKIDELFKGNVELSIPDSPIDSDTQWDGAFGGKEEE